MLDTFFSKWIFILLLFLYISIRFNAERLYSDDFTDDLHGDNITDEQHTIHCRSCLIINIMRILNETNRQEDVVSSELHLHIV
jgi:hypothetical protein